VLLLIVLLPAFGVIATSSLIHRRNVIHGAENSTLLLVQSLAAQQEQIAVGTQQMLSTLAQLPAVKNLDAPACDELFSELKKKYAYYSFLGVTTPDGYVVASAPFDRGTDLSDSKYFQDAVNTLDFSAGEYVVGKISKVPSIHFSYPVLDSDGKLVAILIAGLGLDGYADFLKEANLPEGSVFVITDYRGIRLFHFPESSRFGPGGSISNSTFRNLSGEQEMGTFVKTGQDGVHRIYAFKRLRLKKGYSPYLYLLVGSAKTGIVRAANMELLGNLAGLGVLGILAMLLAWIAAGHLLLKPFKQLAQTTRQLGKGVLGSRTGLPHSPDELGQLAKSFDEMASLLEIRNIQREQAETELQKANDELENKVKDRTAELAKANESLRISEAKYRTLFENAIDPIFVIRENIFADCNESAVKMWGCGRDEIIGKYPYVLSPPAQIDGKDSKEEILKKLADALSGKPQFFAWTLNRRDGTTFDVEISLSRVEVGDEILVLGMFRDITSRKSAEQALKESQQQLADIIDFLPDATFVIDDEGKTIAWNRAMEEMMGVRAADVLGKGDYEYALPFYGERRPILIDLVFAPCKEVERKYSVLENSKGVLAGQVFIPSLKGRGAYIFATASALYDSNGNVVGAIESIRDITNQKVMEEAIARAEEKYRDIFENSVTGLFQVTPDGRFLSVNSAIAHTLGYDSTEELKSSVSDVSQIYVDPRRRPELLRMIQEHGLVRDFEVEFYRKDKSITWASLNVRLVRDKDGKTAYLEGTAVDITESKLIKAQLEEAQRMEAIGKLAGGIAHDFNNILAPIIGYSELSLDLAPQNGKLGNNLKQILLSANRAKDLVRQILTFSRKSSHEYKPVQVGIIAQEALKLLRPSLPSTIDIRQFLHPDAVDSTTMADATQIHQVLMNLCTNAAHAMRPQGGTLSVTLEKVEISSRARRKTPDVKPGPYLKLSVTDTGQGIDEDTKKRIFDPYFTTKGPDEGTGLGLAVVYGIVKNLSGSITVSSKPGKGSTFDVYLPRTATVPQPPPGASTPLLTGHGRILLVDDERLIVDMVKDMLETLGYEVVPKYSSQDALAAFTDGPESFDLIITDLTMPHMTGTGLAGEIFKVRADIPIVLCTGFGDHLDKSRMKSLGIRQILMKPLSLRDLAFAVSTVLGQE
jgi:PAS domain S-box-containing protein